MIYVFSFLQCLAISNMCFAIISFELNKKWVTKYLTLINKYVAKQEHIQDGSSRRGTGNRQIGHISAMFSQPSSSVRALRSHQKLLQMQNIFDGYPLLHF